MGKKPLPIEEKKVRVLLFVEPEIVQEMTKETCQTIGKEAIKKEYKKRLKQSK